MSYSNVYVKNPFDQDQTNFWSEHELSKIRTSKHKKSFQNILLHIYQQIWANFESCRWKLHNHSDTNVSLRNVITSPDKILPIHKNSIFHESLCCRIRCLRACFKVIYTKYSKHCPYSVAHTIDCVCSKMLNHGLNHGLFLSLFKFLDENAF